MRLLINLVRVQPEMADCHSERSEESPANQEIKRFFVAFTPQNDKQELGLRMQTIKIQGRNN